MRARGQRRRRRSKSWRTAAGYSMPGRRATEACRSRKWSLFCRQFRKIPPGGRRMSRLRRDVHAAILQTMFTHRGPPRSVRLACKKKPRFWAGLVWGGALSVMAITSAREHWVHDWCLTKGGTNVSGNLHATTGSDGVGGQGSGHHHQEHVALRSRHLAGAEGGLTSRTTSS